MAASRWIPWNNSSAKLEENKKLILDLEANGVDYRTILKELNIRDHSFRPTIPMLKRQVSKWKAETRDQNLDSLAFGFSSLESLNSDSYLSSSHHHDRASTSPTEMEAEEEVTGFLPKFRAKFPSLASMLGFSKSSGTDDSVSSSLISSLNIDRKNSISSHKSGSSIGGLSFTSGSSSSESYAQSHRSPSPHGRVRLIGDSNSLGSAVIRSQGDSPKREGSVERFQSLSKYTLQSSPHPENFGNAAALPGDPGQSTTSDEVSGYEYSYPYGNRKKRRSFRSTPLKRIKSFLFDPQDIKVSSGVVTDTDTRDPTLDRHTMGSDEPEAITGGTQLIYELIDNLFGAISLYMDSCDTNTLNRLYSALPNLIRAFALRIGYKTRDQRYLDMMDLFYNNHELIAWQFREICEHYQTTRKHSKYSIETLDPNTNPMSVKEKMSLWDQKSAYTVIQAKSGHSISRTGDQMQGTSRSAKRRGMPSRKWGELENSQGYRWTKADPEQPQNTSTLVKPLAFEWLVGSLRREILLVPTEPDCMAMIKNIIISSMPLSYAVSSNQSAESFSGIFITGWKPLLFCERQGFEGKPSEVIDKVITLTGSAGDAQALSCAQYLHQTWPVSSIYLLDVIKGAISSPYTNKLPDGSRITGALTPESSELVIEALGTNDFVGEIGQQLAWLIAALRDSSDERGIITCIPSITLANRRHYKSESLGISAPEFLSSTGDASQPHNSKVPPKFYRLGFSVEALQVDEDTTDSQCWRHIFRNPVLVKGYPIPRRPNWNTGLELPLRMMAGLVQTEYIQIFNKKLLIKGFSILLMPIRRDEDVIIWHLIHGENGNRIPYYEANLPYPEGLNMTDLEDARHVLGWCSDARYYAGAVDARYDIKSSRLPRPQDGCSLGGVRISGRRIITSSHSFILGNKDSPTHISRDSTIQKLKWIHEKFLVFWDEEDRRGWLVNGTSALLHLLRTSLESDSKDDFNSEFCFDKNMIQEAPETHKPSSAIKVLLNNHNRKQKIYPTKDGYLCVEDRLDELFGTLEKIIDYQVDVTCQDAKTITGLGNYLEGWDFNDVANSSVRDPIYPRMNKIPQSCMGWMHFTHVIHAATLFGRGFGEIIRPAEFDGCAQWAKLPAGDYHLAATVRDLRKIMDMNGGYETSPLKLTDQIICKTSEHTFRRCKCKGRNEAIMEHTDFAQELLFLSLDNNNTTHSAPLEDNGALILSSKWLMGDLDDFEVGRRLSLSEEPTLRSQDSGIGSSLGSTFNYEDYTVGIVCALPKELLAVRALFDSTHEDLDYPFGDTNHYALGSIRQHNVVTACLPSGEYGTCAAADILANMKRSFPDLKICLLVGIGGGVPSEKTELRLGDVVVSHPTRDYPGVIQYDLGKTLSNGVFERIGSLQRPPRFIMTAISNLRSNPNIPKDPLGAYLSEITDRFPEYGHPGPEYEQFSSVAQGYARPRSYPKIHYGLIASGNQVMKDAQARDAIGQKYGVLCFEMEAAGVMNTHDCLVIRGICDYSDSRKNDIWQEYAAATAAAYVKLLLSYVRIPSKLPYNRGIDTSHSMKRAPSFDLFNASTKKVQKRPTQGYDITL